MKNFKSLFTTSLAIVIFMIACSDGTTPPTITITSPVSTDQFSTGTMMQLDLDVTDDTEISSININISSSQLATVNTLFDMFIQNISSGTFSLDTMIMAMTPDHSDYILTVIARDDEDNITTDTVSFHIHPGGHHHGGDTNLPHIHIMMPMAASFDSEDTVNIHTHTFSDTTVKKIVATLTKDNTTQVWADSMMGAMDTLHLMGMYILPVDTLSLGDYTLRVEGHDSKGNHKHKMHMFTVSQ